MSALACSAPDLLTQCAVCYASAYEESKGPEFLQQAIKLMELVVCQDYNIPNSTRLLSKLYFEAKNPECDRSYWSLLDRYGEQGVVLLEDKDGSKCFEHDEAEVEKKLQAVLERQFVVAIKASNDGLFNGWIQDVDAKIDKFFEDKSLHKDDSVTNIYLELWDGAKTCLNACFSDVSEKFALPIENLAEVAAQLDATIQNELKNYSGSYASIAFSTDRVAEQHRGIYRAITKAKSQYVDGVLKALTNFYKKSSFTDVAALSEGVAGLEHLIGVFVQQHGITGIQGVGRRTLDVFSRQAREKVIPDSDSKTWEEYQADPSWGSDKMDGRKSFRVTVNNTFELLKASRQIEKDIERKGYKVRVYTEGRGLGVWNGSVCAYIAMHRLCTINPDYEVIRYPKSVEVRYMHDDIHDTADDVGSAGKLYDDVKHDVCGLGRVFSESWERVRGIFS